MALSVHYYPPGSAGFGAGPIQGIATNPQNDGTTMTVDANVTGIGGRGAGTVRVSAISKAAWLAAGSPADQGYYISGSI